ncbi:MAG: ribosome small subunit-dependent GTPase A [Desulfuromonas sp.]|nr:MAG: ribosome small subunit-dependent GTPase A [Desulfuromonas sp.]
MSKLITTLPALGWSHFFQQQLSLDEWEMCLPARVISVHRHLADLLTVEGRVTLPLPGQWYLGAGEGLPTVGDWLLLDRSGCRVVRRLERHSLFRRHAAGSPSGIQLLAANIDTLLIVTSCNQEFKLSRLERYLALALEARVEPVVVIGKSDLADSVNSFVEQARQLHPGLEVVALNALDATSVAQLEPWCRCGQSVALVGSSGVGKSTLIRTLGGGLPETGEIRATDDRGRHTTTARTLYLLPAGGIVIDTPGLRELALTECQDGVASLFDEIEQLARSCRFSDCRHEQEEGCAVKAALAVGELDSRRFGNYQKLQAEQERNRESLAQKRRRERNFSKLVRHEVKRRRKERDS